MTTPFQEQNRGELRRSIGRNLGIVTIGEATSTVDNASLLDTVNLLGGDDEHNNKQVMIYDAAGSIVDGETGRVTDYASATTDATTTAFTASITDGDKYEMWDTPWLVADINDAINQSIIAASPYALKEKQTATNYTERDLFSYNCLSGFKGLHSVEYVPYIDEYQDLHGCNSAWDAATSVTVSLDTEFYREGGSCNKLDVASGVAGGALLATVTIGESNLSNYDTIEFWIRSSIAQTAANLEFYLDNTAACASPVDTMSLPALTIDTWTRVQLTMTNPELDTAVISIGIGQKAATDVGACLIWIDHVRALKANSRKFKELNPQYWSIVRGSTNYLRLTSTGKGITGDNTLLRLNGYQIPTLFTDDTTDADLDPAYIIAQTTGWLALGHAKSSHLQIKDRQKFAQYWLSIAEKLKPRLGTRVHPDSRWF